MGRDLYASVRRGSARRRDWRMWAALCLALALAVATLVPILWSAHYQLRYRELLIELSRSTSSAYQADSLTVERDGETRSASGNCGYQIYTLVAGITPGRWRRPPAEDPAVRLRYGDGSTLELWEVPLKNSSSHGLFLWYTDPKGKSDGYDSKLLQLSGVERLLDQDAETERNGENGSD